MDLKKKIASALSAAIVLMTSVPALGVSGAAVINGGFIKGDINLDKQVSSADIVAVSQYLAGKSTLTEEELVIADMNDDGIVNIFDQILIKRTVLTIRDIRDIREFHKKDSESAPQTTVADELKENLEAVENFKGSRDEKLVILYCKQLGINYKNLSEEEFRWFIRILKKSKKMGTPISQRKKR